MERERRADTVALSKSSLTFITVLGTTLIASITAVLWDTVTTNIYFKNELTHITSRQQQLFTLTKEYTNKAQHLSDLVLTQIATCNERHAKDNHR